jgi:hypothetical protein
MLLVILGAGASFDSVDARVSAPRELKDDNERFLERYRPPLARNLFADRSNYNRHMMRFPDCRPIIQHMRQNSELPDFNVERELEKFQGEANDYPPRRRQLAAVRFYLRHLLWECGSQTTRLSNGMTNHFRFFDRLELWRHKAQDQILIATFNYDVLVEDALREALGITFPNIHSFTSHPEYRLYKLHGSVNWGRWMDIDLEDVIGDQEKVQNQLMDGAAAASPLSDQYKLVSGVDDLGATEAGAYFPAIAVPFERKYDFECPGGQLEDLFRLLPEVTDILIIGWRATELHFLEKVSAVRMDKCRRITIVAGAMEFAEHTMTNLVRADINQNIEPTAHSFTEFCRAELDDWLAKGIASPT